MKGPGPQEKLLVRVPGAADAVEMWDAVRYEMT